MNWIEEYYKSRDELDALKSQYDYERILFKDRVEEFPNVFTHEEIGGGRVRHLRFPGQIFQEGTPLSAANLGHMDLGIYMLWLLYKDLAEQMQVMAIEVAGLKGAALNNMPHNQFFISFENLESITVIEGYYDEANKKVVNG